MHQNTPLTQNQQAAITQAAELIAAADGIIIAAGAGMGVDSGLPDFRGDEGFWKAYPALGQAGLRFTEIASPDYFESNPRLAWGFYGHRLGLYRRTQPHAGFALLRQWAAEKRTGGFVFTSNVDGQFQKAGFDAQRIDECHGSIHHTQCSANCCEAYWSAADISDADIAQIDHTRCLWQADVPACHQCGAVLRPNILMFNDPNWQPMRQQAQRRRLEQWLGQWQISDELQPPVVIELGAGTAVVSVRHFTRRVCELTDARLIRINVREPAVAREQDVALDLGALAALQAIAQELKGA